MRIVLRDLAQGTVGHKRDLARGESANPVIHLSEQKAVQVGEVARNVKGRDLPPTIREMVVTASKARNDEAALGWAVTFAHDVLASIIVPDPRCDFVQYVLFLPGERAMPFKSANQELRHATTTRQETIYS
jgi:hypothetical protein